MYPNRFSCACCDSDRPPLSCARALEVTVSVCNSCMEQLEALSFVESAEDVAVYFCPRCGYAHADGECLKFT